jgi:hypothetical protein
VNGNRNLYILVGIIVLAAAVILAVVSTQDARYNWTETFDNQGKEPYDLSLFRQVMEATAGKDSFTVISDLKSDTNLVHKTGTAFIYIDSRAFFDSSNVDMLLSYAANGNTILISAANNHKIITSLLGDCISQDLPLVKRIKAKRVYPSLAETDTNAVIYYNEIDEIQRYPWTWYDLEYCEADSVQEIGNFKAIDRWYTNTITVEHGTGKIILHSTPLMFTNYHMRNEPVYEHAQLLLSQADATELVWYDPKVFISQPQNRPLITESPLKFILGNAPLRWAWYTLILLAMLFLITGVRRLQRPVPVLAAPPNDTLAYLDVVSRMYQKEGRHKHVVQVQYKLMLNHLRIRYKLPVSNIDKSFFREASIRLKIDEPAIIEFFAELDRARNNSTLTDEDLAMIDYKITEFYARCP